MIRGTTPTLTLTVGPSSLDLTQADEVLVSFRRQGQTENTITKSGADVSVSGNVVSCWLTEEESLAITEGSAGVQVNWLYTENGVQKRAASQVAVINIGKQLLPEPLIGGD